MTDFWDLLDEPGARIIVDLVQAQIERAEKAHPLVPDNVRDLIESGLGIIPKWQTLYYIPEPDNSRIFGERYEKWVQYYKKLWEAWEELDSPYEPEPEFTPEFLKRARDWTFFDISVTSSKEAFEKTRELLKNARSLEEIVEIMKREYGGV